MATNIEIKARVEDPAGLRVLIESLSDKPCEVIHQEDTFFDSPRGRFKLRVLSPESGQLIYYERADLPGPKRSDYFISSTDDPESLKTVMARALGVRGVVRKVRRLYFSGNTRIHLDEVEGLGCFLELEVVLEPGQSAGQGQAIAASLIDSLGIEPGDLIEGAYLDLIERNGSAWPSSHGDRA